MWFPVQSPWNWLRLPAFTVSETDCILRPSVFQSGGNLLLSVFLKVNTSSCFLFSWGWMHIASLFLSLSFIVLETQSFLSGFNVFFSLVFCLWAASADINTKKLFLFHRLVRSTKEPFHFLFLPTYHSRKGFYNAVNPSFSSNGMHFTAFPPFL